MADDGLKPKQRLFVAEYLVDLNGKQAAIRAGYSAKTAEQQASRLLSLVKVQAAIEAGMAEREKRTGITADRVLQELANIGFANISDVVDWGQKEVTFGFDGDGKQLPPGELGDAVMVRTEFAPFVEPKNRDELAPGVRAAVAEVSLGKDGLKIRMHDKGAALQKIGQHLGMFRQKVDVAVTVDDILDAIADED